MDTEQNFIYRKDIRLRLNLDEIEHDLGEEHIPGEFEDPFHLYQWGEKEEEKEKPIYEENNEDEDEDDVQERLRERSTENTYTYRGTKIGGLQDGESYMDQYDEINGGGSHFVAFDGNRHGKAKAVFEENPQEGQNKQASDTTSVIPEKEETVGATYRGSRVGGLKEGESYMDAFALPEEHHGTVNGRKNTAAALPSGNTDVPFEVQSESENLGEEKKHKKSSSVFEIEEEKKPEKEDKDVTNKGYVGTAGSAKKEPEEKLAHGRVKNTGGEAGLIHGKTKESSVELRGRVGSAHPEQTMRGRVGASPQHIAAGGNIAQMGSVQKPVIRGRVGESKKSSGRVRFNGYVNNALLAGVTVNVERGVYASAMFHAVRAENARTVYAQASQRVSASPQVTKPQYAFDISSPAGTRYIRNGRNYRPGQAPVKGYNSIQPLYDRNGRYAGQIDSRNIARAYTKDYAMGFGNAYSVGDVTALKGFEQKTKGGNAYSVRSSKQSKKGGISQYSATDIYNSFEMLTGNDRISEEKQQASGRRMKVKSARLNERSISEITGENHSGVNKISTEKIRLGRRTPSEKFTDGNNQNRTNKLFRDEMAKKYGVNAEQMSGGGIRIRRPDRNEKINTKNDTLTKHREDRKRESREKRMKVLSAALVPVIAGMAGGAAGAGGAASSGKITLTRGNGTSHQAKSTTESQNTNSVETQKAAKQKKKNQQPKKKPWKRLTAGLLALGLAAGGFLESMNYGYGLQQNNMPLMQSIVYDATGENTDPMTQAAYGIMKSRLESIKNNVAYGRPEGDGNGSSGPYGSSVGDGAPFDTPDLWQGHRYNFNTDQIRQITALCLYENGSPCGIAWETSQILNHYELQEADPTFMTNQHRAVGLTPEEKVMDNLEHSGWWAEASNHMHSYCNGSCGGNQGVKNPTSTQLEIVERVTNQGMRVLPLYIDEHDEQFRNGATTSTARLTPVNNGSLGGHYYVWGNPPDDPKGDGFGGSLDAFRIASKAGWHDQYTAQILGDSGPNTYGGPGGGSGSEASNVYATLGSAITGASAAAAVGSNHDGIVTTDMLVNQVASVYEWGHKTPSHGKSHIKYGDSKTEYPGEDGLCSCDRLVARALYELGFNDGNNDGIIDENSKSAQPLGGFTCGNMREWLVDHGWIESYGFSNITRGSIVLVKCLGVDYFSHAFFVLDFNHETHQTTKYDFGTDERIGSKQPFVNEPWFYKSSEESILVFNMPPGGVYADGSGMAGTEGYNGSLNLPKIHCSKGTFIDADGHKTKLTEEEMSRIEDEGVVRLERKHTYTGDVYKQMWVGNGVDYEIIHHEDEEGEVDSENAENTEDTEDTSKEGAPPRYDMNQLAEEVRKINENRANNGISPTERYDTSLKPGSISQEITDKIIGVLGDIKDYILLAGSSSGLDAARASGEEAVVTGVSGGYESVCVGTDTRDIEMEVKDVNVTVKFIGKQKDVAGKVKNWPNSKGVYKYDIEYNRLFGSDLRKYNEDNYLQLLLNYLTVGTNNVSADSNSVSIKCLEEYGEKFLDEDNEDGKFIFRKLEEEEERIEKVKEKWKEEKENPVTDDGDRTPKEKNTSNKKNSKKKTKKKKEPEAEDITTYAGGKHLGTVEVVDGTIRDDDDDDDEYEYYDEEDYSELKKIESSGKMWLRNIQGQHEIDTSSSYAAKIGYLQYACDLVDASIDVVQRLGFEVEYREEINEYGNVKWTTEDGGEAQASPEHVLYASVIIYIDACPDDFTDTMKKYTGRPFKGKTYHLEKVGGERFGAFDHMEVFHNYAPNFEYFMKMYRLMPLTAVVKANSRENGGGLVNVSDVAAAVYRFLHKKGLSDACIAGILGNMAQECGGESLKLDMYLEEKNGVGYGLIQWSDTRRKDLEKWATKNNGWVLVDGKRQISLDCQLDFLWDELFVRCATWGGNKSNKDKFLRAKTAKEAAEMFCWWVEHNTDGSPQKAYNWKDGKLKEVRVPQAELAYRLIRNGGFAGGTIIEIAKAMASDSRVGYSRGDAKSGPTGRFFCFGKYAPQSLDTDCSGFVFYVLYFAGYLSDLDPHEPFYTGDMVDILKKHGFVEVPLNDLQPGDVLHYCEKDDGNGDGMGHTEIYFGDGKTIGAHSNDSNSGGDPGGGEVSIVNMKHNFRRALRPPPGGVNPVTIPIQLIADQNPYK